MPEISLYRVRPKAEVWALVFAPAAEWRRCRQRFARVHAEQTAQSSEQRADTFRECVGPNDRGLF